MTPESCQVRLDPLRASCDDCAPSGGTTAPYWWTSVLRTSPEPVTNVRCRTDGVPGFAQVRRQNVPLFDRLRVIKQQCLNQRGSLRTEVISLIKLLCEW